MTAAGVDLSDVTASSSADDKRFRTGDIDLPVRHAERQGELIASRYRKQEFTHAPHRLLMPYAMQGLPMRLMRKNEMEQEELLALERLSLQAAPELYAGRGIETQAEPKRLRDLKLEKRRRENQIAVVPEEATPEDEPEEASATPDLQPEGEPVEAVPGPDDVAAGQEPFVGGWGGTVLEADAAQAGATQDQHLRQTRRRSSAAFVSLMSRRASAADVQGYQHQHLGQSHGRHGGVAEQEDNGADGETAPEAMGNELLGLIHLIQVSDEGKLTKEEYRALSTLYKRRVKGSPTDKFLDEISPEDLVEEVQQYQEMFYLIDADGSGEIDKQELTLLLCAAFGMEETEDTSLAESIIHVVDHSGTGTIHYSDFLLSIPFFIRLHDEMLKHPTSADAIDFKIVVSELLNT